MEVFGWSPEPVLDLAPRDIVFFVLVPEPIPVPGGCVVRVPMPPYDDRAGGASIGRPPAVEPSITLRFWQATAPSGLDGRALEMIDRAMRAAVPEALLPDRGRILANAAGDDPASLDTYRTVVEIRAGMMLRSEASILATFDRAVDALYEFHRAYRVARRAQIVPLTRERLHQIVPFVTVDSTGAWDRATGWVIAHPHLPHAVAPDLLGPADVPGLEAHMDQLRRAHPAGLYLERLLPAYATFDAGDYATATLLCAIAVEVLVDSLLALALWGGEVSPADAARRFSERSMVRRVRLTLPDALGDDRSLWSPERDGPAGRWRRDLHNLRNAIAHRGYPATRDDAFAAFEAAEQFEAHAHDRLMVAAQRLPRAAVLFFGAPALQRAGQLTGKLLALATLDRLDRFNLWRDAVDEAALRGPGAPR